MACFTFTSRLLRVSTVFITVFKSKSMLEQCLPGDKKWADCPCVHGRDTLDAGEVNSSRTCLEGSPLHYMGRGHRGVVHLSSYMQYENDEGRQSIHNVKQLLKEIRRGSDAPPHGSHMDAPFPCYTVTERHCCRQANNLVSPVSGFI